MRNRTVVTVELAARRQQQQCLEPRISVQTVLASSHRPEPEAMMRHNIRITDDQLTMRSWFTPNAILTWNDPFV